MAPGKAKHEVIDTDLLIVGGGTAGCPMAAKATEHGLRVTMVEKSKTERSGNIGHGCDAYGIFAKDGLSVKQAVQIWSQKDMQGGVNGPGRWVNPNIDGKLFAEGYWALEELEKMGIPMRWYDGEYYWTPHLLRTEGGQLVKAGLRVPWQNAKPKMAKIVRERGVNVLDRVMIVDLLTHDGKVTGATAVNTRTGEFMVIKARAIAVGTGMYCRCFDPETPTPWKYKFRYHYNPASISGDGWAMAYRAGAELIHMDITGWAFRIRDDATISFGNFPNNDGVSSRVFDWRGNEPPRSAISSVKGYLKAEIEGKTPFYQSLTHMPDDFQKRMELCYNDEWLLALKMAQDRKFNPRTHWYEFMTNAPLQMMNVQGVYTDDSFATNVSGLYAVGDNAAGVGGAYGACISGLTVGDNVSAYIGAAAEPVVDEDQVESQKQEALAPLAVTDGTEPMEMECAVRYICMRYGGNLRSEGKLREGLRRFYSLKENFQLMATNPHYLMRCLEVRNIMDLAELYLKGCLNRNESRGNNVRVDHPEMDPAWDFKCSISRLKDGDPVIELKEMPDLKPEYLEAGEE